MTRLEFPAALERAREGDVVGVFEVGAAGQATGEACHLHAGRANEPLDEHGSCFTLKAGIGGHDDLLDYAILQAENQFSDVDIFRANTVHRIEDAVKHVILAAVAARTVDCEHIKWLFDDADDGAVAAFIRAVAAGVTLGDVHADRAEVDAPLDFEHGVGELLRLLLARPENVVGESLGRLRADAGQPVKRLDQALDGFGSAGSLGHARSLLLAEAGQAEPAGDRPEGARLQIGGLLAGIGDGGHDEVLEHFDIIGVDDIG